MMVECQRNGVRGVHSGRAHHPQGMMWDSDRSVQTWDSGNPCESQIRTSSGQSLGKHRSSACLLRCNEMYNAHVWQGEGHAYMKHKGGAENGCPAGLALPVGDAPGRSVACALHLLRASCHQTKGPKGCWQVPGRTSG